VKFWVDNLVANEVELDIAELASMYLESGWPVEEQSMGRKLRLFLAKELHLTWDPDEGDELISNLGSLIYARSDITGGEVT